MNKINNNIKNEQLNNEDKKMQTLITFVLFTVRNLCGQASPVGYHTELWYTSMKNGIAHLNTEVYPVDGTT